MSIRWPWSRHTASGVRMVPLRHLHDHQTEDDLDRRAVRHHQLADYAVMFGPTREWPDLRPRPDKALMPTNSERPEAPLMTPGQEWRAGLRSLNTKEEGTE